MRRSPPVLFAVLCAATFAPAARTQSADETTVVEVRRHEGLVVRDCVQQAATPAERDWLWFEFDNPGKTPLQVFAADFRLDRAEVSDLATGRPVCSQSLVTGNGHDLFGERFAAKGVELAPGVTRIGEPVADYAAALLRVPVAPWRVSARAWVQLTTTAGTLQAPDDGVPFSFRWLPPDEAGRARLRQTVHELVAAPRLPIGTLYLAKMLLKTPGVGDTATLGELLAARERRSPDGAWNTWQHAVLEHLDTVFAADPALLAWARDRLASDDRAIVADLTKLPHVWAPAFLPELLRRYEAGDRGVLWVLEQRGGPHRGDAEARRRLSAPLVAGFRATPASFEVLSGDERHSERFRLTSAIRELGYTRDPAVVPLLAPWLDCREPLFDTRAPLGWSGCAPPPPARLCDEALEAIQRVLGEDPHAPLQAPGRPTPADYVGLEQATAIRDRLIAELRTRLAKAK